MKRFQYWMWVVTGVGGGLAAMLGYALFNRPSLNPIPTNAEDMSRPQASQPIHSSIEAGISSIDRPPSELRPTGSEDAPGGLHTLVDQLRGLPLRVQYDRFLDALGIQDFELSGALAIVLSGSLRTCDMGEAALLLTQFRKDIFDESVNMDQRLALVQILGDTDSPATLETLLLVMRSAPSGDIRDAAAQHVSRAGWTANDELRESLSEVLELAWKDPSETNPENLQSLARALGSVGTPSGIELLLDDATQSPKQGTADRGSLEAREVAALDGLSGVRNPLALRVLGPRLEYGTGGAAEKYICGSTLAQMGNVGATMILLTWAESAADEEQELAEEWFSLVRDPDSLKVMNAALSLQEGHVFRSAKIRGAVERAYLRALPQ